MHAPIAGELFYLWVRRYSSMMMLLGSGLWAGFTKMKKWVSLGRNKQITRHFLNLSNPSGALCVGLRRRWRIRIRARRTWFEQVLSWALCVFVSRDFMMRDWAGFLARHFAKLGWALDHIKHDNKHAASNQQNLNALAKIYENPVPADRSFISAAHCSKNWVQWVVFKVIVLVKCRLWCHSAYRVLNAVVMNEHLVWQVSVFWDGFSWGSNYG